MLFLPQSVYDARARLWRSFDAGKLTEDQVYQQGLELDPDDYIGLAGLARLRQEAGDPAAAEAYLWRAIQAHPCMSSPYLALAHLLSKQPDSAPLSEALGELGIGKSALDDEAFLEGLDPEKAGLEGEAAETFRQLPASAKAQLIVGALRAKRDEEPEAVTERLRQLRMIHQIQEEDSLDPETVDAIVAQGESIAPLLVGVLRGWAQDLLGEDGDVIVENAMALVGETGSPSEIRHLLEFIDLEDENASGVAAWALGRIIQRHTGESARLIGSMAAGLGAAHRLALAEQILRNRALDPAGELLERLSENLEAVKRADRDEFFPTLLGAMAGARGPEGVSLGRKILLERGHLLSKNARRDCDDLLAAFQHEGVSPVAIEPSPLTVYDICAGDAIWDDDEDDEVPEEELKPVRRAATPGRNDPCWCNSGRKYKKCHLDSDQQRDHQTSARSNEFAALRRSLAEFLGQVLPPQDITLASDEFFADQQEVKEIDGRVAVFDWVLHDRISPRLARTVMQEFLIRRGARLSDRERQMVEAWSRSFIGLYEVQEVTEGVGVKLKDLLLGETLFVHDVSLSKRVARWDGLLTRVVPGERGTELAGIGLTVPRHSIGPLRDWMEEDRAGLDWREYLKGNWARIRRRSLEISAEWMDSLRLANIDGEELLFSKAVYQVIDEAAVVGVLQSCPELHAEDSDEADEYFVWTNEQQTVLGNIYVYLQRGELALDCNSRERMERGKTLLSNIAGESLRHLRDEFTTQKELKSRAMAPRGAVRDEPEVPKKVRDEVISRLMEGHYRKWPDIKLPALGGKTPRQAVRSVKGRRQVIALLKDFENGEDRKRRAGDPFYDISRLRVELGLE